MQNYCLFIIVNLKGQKKPKSNKLHKKDCCGKITNSHQNFLSRNTVSQDIPIQLITYVPYMKTVSKTAQEDELPLTIKTDLHFVEMTETQYSEFSYKEFLQQFFVTILMRVMK